MSVSGDRRLATFESEAFFLPCGKAQAHVVDLQFTGVTGGNFRLRVNGKETANISWSGTIATLVSNITAALTNSQRGKFNVAANSGLARITATANAFYRVEILDVNLTGTNKAFKTIIITQGSKLNRLSADIMSMKFGRKVKTTETAGLSELEDYPEVVGSSGTFSLSMYGTVTGDWIIPMSTEGLSGIIYWFPRGHVVGRTYSAMRVVLDGFDEDLPFHEKVEVAITGTRQGKMIAPTNTVLQRLLT